MTKTLPALLVRTTPDTAVAATESNRLPQLPQLACLRPGNAPSRSERRVRRLHSSMPPSPTLYRLAADRRYDQIPERVASHPQDLQWTDRYGSTALHILCQARTCDRNLLQAVTAILSMAPEQVAWPNAATWTPLHFAAEKRWESEPNEHLSTCLILKLIRACPQAVSVKTHSGFKTKTPFGIACEADADYCVLQAMLRINPSLACEPFVQRQAFVDSYTVAENPLQVLWKNNKSSRTKDKMALLLQAAQLTNGAARTAAPFYILHAACSVRCPRDYFLQLLREHADQVRTPDHLGLYPLHYAVGHHPTHHGSESSPVYTQFVIESLLEACPEAAQATDGSDRLPLHLAVETLKTWHKTGLRELVFCYPEALRRVDPHTGLVPFLASAPAATKSRLHLSTTYELLLAAPEMVRPHNNSRRLGKAAATSPSQPPTASSSKQKLEATSRCQ